MTVTLSHSCQRPAMAEDRGSIEQIVCALSNDLRVLGEQAQAEQDFERGSSAPCISASWPPSERAVLASELQGLDVDVPEVRIGGRSHRRVLRCTETYLSAVAPITVQRTLYRAGQRACGGRLGAEGRDRRRLLDAAGGASGEPADGAPDAAGECRCAAGVGQHESVQEQPGPAAEAPEQPLGAGARKGSRTRCVRPRRRCLLRRRRWRCRWTG